MLRWRANVSELIALRMRMGIQGGMSLQSFFYKLYLDRLRWAYIRLKGETWDYRLKRRIHCFLERQSL